jgi:hypothetical protein
MKPRSSFGAWLQQGLSPLLAVTWRQDGGAQGMEGGAVEAVGELWVDSARCAVVSEVLGAVLTVVERQWWPLLTALATVTWL